MADSDTQLEEDAGSALGQDDNQNASKKQSPLQTLVVGGPGFKLNGNWVRITQVPDEARATKIVEIAGENLQVYNKVFLRFGDKRKLVAKYLPDDKDLQPTLIRFPIPDLDYALKEDDAVWMELVSENHPQISGVVSRYLKYKTLESQQKEFEQGEQLGEQLRAKEGFQTGTSVNQPAKESGMSKFANQVFNSGTGMMSGVASALATKTAAVKENREKLKQALASGDSQAVSLAIEEAKKLEDREGLKLALKNEINFQYRSQISSAISSVERSGVKTSSGGLSASTEIKSRVSGSGAGGVVNRSFGGQGNLESEYETEIEQEVSGPTGQGTSNIQSESSLDARIEAQSEGLEEVQGKHTSKVARGQELSSAQTLEKTSELSGQVSEPVSGPDDSELDASIRVLEKYAQSDPEFLLQMSGGEILRKVLQSGSIAGLSEEEKQLLRGSIQTAAQSYKQSNPEVSKALGQVSANLSTKENISASQKAETQSEETRVKTEESKPAVPKEIEAEIANLKKSDENLNIALGQKSELASPSGKTKLKLKQDLNLRTRRRAGQLSAKSNFVRTAGLLGRTRQGLDQDLKKVGLPDEAQEEPAKVPPEKFSEQEAPETSFEPQNDTAEAPEQSLPEKKPDFDKEVELPEENQPQAEQQASPIEQVEKKTSKPASSALAQEVNAILNRPLLQAAVWVWSLAIPTFGLSILLGAIVGDFLWVFKGWLIEKALSAFKLAKGGKIDSQLKNITSQIKFSWAVKFNIIVWNLLVLLVILLIMAFFVATLKWACDGPVAKGTSWVLGYDGLCEMVENMDGGSYFDFVSSRNVEPIGPLSTQKWNEQISTIAGRYGIDACILKVVVQKESGGQESIIGCDCAANGHPEFCLQGARGQYTPAYRFNWEQCSYGIGLTQWTIFPQSRFPWCSASPSRQLFGTCYSVQDFLNPLTSLDLTARSFAANMQTFARSQGRNAPPFTRQDAEEGFWKYVGDCRGRSSGCSVQTRYVAERMALYDLCKNTSAPSLPSN